MVDQRLTKDRPPLPTGVPVDSRRHVSAADEELLARFSGCVRELGRIAERMPAHLHVVRDSIIGQPQAAAAHDSGSGLDPLALLWCEVHERTVADCDHAGLLCEGSADRQVSDPVGRAAVVNDRASADLRRIRSQLEQIVAATISMAALLGAYPVDVQHLEQLGPDDEIGTVWCRCCHKDDKRCEPITLRSSGPQAGQPYYPGLCRWCGRKKAVLGFEPPAWMVAMHHRGERVNSGHDDRAIRERGQVATASKGKRRRRK